MGYPHVSQGAFQMEMYGSHCAYIWGSVEDQAVCMKQLPACEWSVKLMISPTETHELNWDA